MTESTTSQANAGELLERAHQIVDMAQKAGADESWVSVRRSREVEFSLRDGKLEEVKDATSRSVSLRLYVDGRYSTHSTTVLRPQELGSFISEAVALTRALQPDSFRLITDPLLFEGRSTKDLQLVDSGVSALTRDERIDLCKAQNAELAGKEKVISATSGTSDGHVMSAAVSSNGFEGSKENTYMWIGSSLTVQGEGDKKPAAWMWAGANHRADVPSPIKIATEAMRRAHSRLGTQKGPTTKTTMIVHPSAAPRLIGRLLGPLNASLVQQGRSFWADKQGQKAVSELLSISDDPLIPRALGSRLYDGEGIAAKAMPLITAGALDNYYVNTYYGRKLGWAPTTGSSSNRIVALGDKDMTALMSDAGSGVLVEGWLGGNADSTTGDFSFGVRGHMINNGVLGAPVSEMNVTGNLLDLFSSLVALGNDPWPYSSTKAPTLVFEGVQFSGV